MNEPFDDVDIRDQDYSMVILKASSYSHDGLNFNGEGGFPLHVSI
jgi:hypothetical protein